jgi:hypothetical protein
MAEGALPWGNLQIDEGRNKSGEIERGCMQIARIENDLIFPVKEWNIDLKLITLF